MSPVIDTLKSLDQLVQDANCKSSWETRLAALNELKNYDCQQSHDVITRLALHDKVFAVKEEAFRVAQEFGITKKGQPIRLGKKNIGYKQKQFTSLFQKVKREKGMVEFDIDVFKLAFQNADPEMYDVMKFDKSNKFDSWIENTFKSLPKK